MGCCFNQFHPNRGVILVVLLTMVFCRYVVLFRVHHKKFSPFVPANLIVFLLTSWYLSFSGCVFLVVYRAALFDMMVTSRKLILFVSLLFGLLRPSRAKCPSFWQLRQLLHITGFAEQTWWGVQFSCPQNPQLFLFCVGILCLLFFALLVGCFRFVLFVLFGISSFVIFLSLVSEGGM